MTSPRLALPTLYLYSRDDPLACAAKLDGLVAARRAAGADARAHCWPESPHVGHLRRHPEQYKRLVLEFLGSLHT
jgi:pimeloyl-ACP methyl ester carboxylesterase